MILISSGVGGAGAERNCAMVVASINQLVISQMSCQAGLPLFRLLVLRPSASLKVSEDVLAELCDLTISGLQTSSHFSVRAACKDSTACLPPSQKSLRQSCEGDLWATRDNGNDDPSHDEGNCAVK